MNAVTLPPSPNWYLSRILCCAANGTVAWGARNTIVIVEQQPNSKIPRYSHISNAHQERVTCLAFSSQFGSQDKNLIVSGGDEHIVRIWNLDTLSAVTSVSYIDAKQKVIGVDWSKCDPDLVCIVSHDGLLMSWTISFNACQLYSLGKFTATCLACCPHKSNIVAIGTKSGLVYVVNLQGNGTINYKLRGHDVEITSLSWCPTEKNIFNDSRSEDMLLASGAKDRSVFVWRAGGDGRYQFNITLPVAPMDSQQHRVKLSSSVGNWTAVCWSEPRLLLASSSWGELISWDFTMGPKNKPVCKLLHAHHTRGLFCIANVPKKNPIEDEEEPSSTIVWTLAQDRQVIRSSIKGAVCKLEYSVPTQGGYVYCVAACPLDTCCIAFGVGDAMLRLWNLSEPHETSFDVTSQWQKIMGKIRSIAWHPEKENLLAFGTGEGRVGIWDTNMSSKPPTLYRQYHRNTVYSLGWGPNPVDKNFVLYSCGDNELVYYPFDKLTKEAKPVVQKGCTEFAWKPDFSCMAVGHEDGCISFMDPNLREVGRPIYALKKAIQCLAWHPESTATDLNLSPLRNYLAVAINSPTITILDLTDFVESMENSKVTDNNDISAENCIVRYKIIGNLTGHSDKVVSLAWSPHSSGYLISGSYDNTAQIWKIESQELVATYVEHKAPVHCCMWSPLDPDYVITGSADFTLRVWKISEQKIVLPSESSRTKRVRTKKGKGKKVTSDSTNEIVVEKPENTAGKTTNADQIRLESIVELPKDRNGGKMKEERCKKVDYFSSHTKRMSDKSLCLKSLRDLANRVYQSQTGTTNVTNGKDHDDDIDEKVPTIFGSLDEITTILEEEKLSHTSKGRYTTTTEMSMWNNSLRKDLQRATSEKRLNDFLVSLSAGLSMKTWQETCEAYATQLLFESNYNKAISYLLSIHKIHRAVEILIEQKMYREAYVLARCKLDKDDAILTRILNDWANSASRDGDFEKVAQCYVTLGDFAKAARFLGRRREIKTLETATEIGRFANEPSLIQSLAEQTLTEALLVSDFSTARALVDKFDEISHRQPQIQVFEEIKEMLANVLEPASVSTWLETGKNYDLLSKLRSRCEKYSSFYGLLSMITSTVAPENEAMLWITASQHLAMYATADTEEKQMCHLISALGAISQYEIVHPKKTSDIDESLLMRFLANLEGKSPYEAGSLFTKNDLIMCKSLRAFLCLGLLNWLGNEKARESINLNEALNLIEKLLVDTIDALTVKYWAMANQVNKLETSLASTLGKSAKADENESKDDPTDLLERLNRMRSEKKRFLEERICAPSPILVYSKATHLSNILPDGISKDNFSRIVLETWSSAI